MPSTGTYPFHFLMFFRQRNMVFPSKSKAITKNYFEEKGWMVYRVFKQFKSKEWLLSSAQRLLERFTEYGSMKSKTSSGRTITVTTDENTELVEELIYSPEEFSGTHKGHVKSLEILVTALVRKGVS